MTSDRQCPLLQVTAGNTPSRTPVWFMRQAGRSLPEYHKVREGIAMLDACLMPELLAEITMQPVRRHDVDAAIVFSDIVVPLKVAGVGVDIVPGRGPVMDHPVRSKDDIDKLPQLDQPIESLAQGISMIREELREDQALIGFAGAPFTLASYVVEGGPSKSHGKTKAMMHADPQAWHALMRALVPTVVGFLRTQIEAGVDAIQLFDSWAGFLSERDYREFVLPYSQEVFSQVHGLSSRVVRFHFGVATGELLGAMADAGPEVVGVDWRVPLDVAAQRMGRPVVLQGNLDPALLLADEDVVRAEVTRIAEEARRAMAAGDATGHIFNLGHGVLPETPAEAITRAVEIIHESGTYSE